MLSRESVLRNPTEFRAVYQAGKKRVSRCFVIFSIRNEVGRNRYGLTTPRKLGKAHERNRIKRRFREIIRNLRVDIPSGFDIVINPRRLALHIGFAELRSELTIVLGENG